MSWYLSFWLRRRRLFRLSTGQSPILGAGQIENRHASMHKAASCSLLFYFPTFFPLCLPFITVHWPLIYVYSNSFCLNYYNILQGVVFRVAKLIEDMPLLNSMWLHCNGRRLA